MLIVFFCSILRTSACTGFAWWTGVSLSNFAEVRYQGLSPDNNVWGVNCKVYVG